MIVAFNTSTWSHFKYIYAKVSFTAETVTYKCLQSPKIILDVFGGLQINCNRNQVVLVMVIAGCGLYSYLSILSSIYDYGVTDKLSHISFISYSVLKM